MQTETDKFQIFFHGNFIPLQGVQFIVKAAKILAGNPEIIFYLIGQGQTRAEAIELAKQLELKNIIFIDRVPGNELPSRLKAADLCLGIFGDTEKTLRVIPNKVYECIAMAKPVISADTPAIRELFTDRENILLCKVADANSLAGKILKLKNNEDLRRKIAVGGYELYRSQARPAVIGKKLLESLGELYGK